MPAAKPGSVVTIATNTNYDAGPRTGSPTKISPADTANGFTPGVTVTPEDHNFLHNLAAQWHAYVRDYEQNNLTFSGTATFNALVSDTVAALLKAGATIGGDLVSTGSDADTPRVTVPTYGTAATQKTLILEIGSNTVKVRAYHLGGGLFQLTVNAVWDNDLAGPLNKWLKDDDTYGAFLLQFQYSGSQFVLATKDAAEDSAWSDVLDDSGGWTTSLIQHDSANGGASVHSLVSDGRLDATDYNASNLGLRYCEHIGVAQNWNHSVTTVYAAFTNDDAAVATPPQAVNRVRRLRIGVLQAAIVSMSGSAAAGQDITFTIEKVTADGSGTSTLQTITMASGDGPYKLVEYSSSNSYAQGEMLQIKIESTGGTQAAKDLCITLCFRE